MYSKKKKVDFKKNVINLGFDPGFTKNLFKSSLSGGSLILDNPNNKIKKKKPIKTLTKQIIKSKKKKSSWD
jgi:hypothetical protein